MNKKPRRISFILLCFLFIFEQSGFAQIAGQLDISGHLASLHNAFAPDIFRPLHLRYLSYNPQENNFQLFLDKGSFKNPKSQELEDTTKQLLNYFFVGITLPNDSFWVNLRPDAEDNIIDGQLAQTDVGKILLESDLQLKKDTARFTSPETPEGKEYWDKLYQKAGEIFGSSNITIPTLTRPWIVPDEIIIRETTDSAYIYKAALKVMLEQDYLKDSTVYNFKDERLKELNEYSSQIIRELIIPKLTKEVNTSKRYAPLRQVYYSLILAQWFKQKFYGRGGLYSSLIDRRNLNGLTSKTDWSNTTYFKAYQKSFKDGEYNLKEPVYTPYGQTIRSYFSGGIAFTTKEIFASIQQQLIQAKATISQRVSLFQERLDYLLEVLVYGGNQLEPAMVTIASSNVQRPNAPDNIQQHFFSQTKGSGASSSSVSGGEKSGFTPISTGKSGKDRKEIEGVKLINGRFELGDERDIKLTGPIQGKLYKETINKALDIIRRFRNIDHLNAEIRFCRDSKHFFEFTREGERKIFYIDVSFIDDENFTPGRIALCLNHLITYYEGGNEVKAIYNNILLYGILAQYYSPEEFHRGWAPEIITYFEFLRREYSTKLSPYWAYRFINDSGLYENEIKREIERKNLTLTEMVNRKDLKLEDIIEVIFYEEFSQEDERIPPGLLNFLATRIRYANASSSDLLQRIRAELDEVVSRSRTAYAFRVDLSAEQQKLLEEAQGILERQFQKVMHQPFAINLPEMANAGKIIFTTAIPGLLPNGFIDELSSRMYLFSETATFGVAIHETIHLVVRTILPVTLDEGYTEYKTRQILQADNRDRTPQIYEEELCLFKEILGEDKQEVLILFDQSGNREDFTKILGKNGEIVLAIIEAIDILITNSKKKIDLIKRVIKSQYSPESLLLLIEEIEKLLLGIEHSFFNKEATIFSDSFKNRLINLPQQKSTGDDKDKGRQLSIDEKIMLVSQKHGDSYSAIQKEHNLDSLIYSITDPEGARDTINWLYENDYLDSSKKFCDPFMGNGLLVHLAHVITEADSTGYEKDSRIHQEAVKISIELSDLGVVDLERIHFILGDSSSVSLKQYDVFYILPPWEDGIPNPMLVWDVIANMKIGAIMVLTRGIDPTSIYYRPFHLEDYIEKIADIKGGGVVYRRISKLPPDSSPTQPASDTKGGIDFRGLPVVTQPIGNIPGVNLNTPFPTNSRININLNEEWSQIQNMLNAGIIPSSQRIKEYLIACCEKDNFNQEIDKILSCIANILRLQEDNCCSTESALREILSLLESDKSAEEFTFALTNITPQPQEPKAQPSP